MNRKRKNLIQVTKFQMQSNLSVIIDRKIELNPPQYLKYFATISIKIIKYSFQIIGTKKASLGSLFKFRVFKQLPLTGICSIS